MEDRHLARMVLGKGKEIPDGPALLFKEAGAWKTITYGEFSERILRTAAFLKDMGISRGDRVAIFSANMPEWSIADLSILAIGAVSVPIYATNTSDQAQYIIEDSNSKMVMVGSKEHHDKVSSYAKDKGIKLVSFRDIDEEGTILFRSLWEKEARPQVLSSIEKDLSGFPSSDIATIIYTSGTTGEPKGVVLTHSNLFHQIDSVDEYFDVGPQDRSLCFLPLSHVFERAWTYFIFHAGAQNHYMEDPKLVMEYLSDVRPTVMVSVPRLFEKIHSTANERLRKASPLKRTMFSWSLKAGKSYNTLKAEGKTPGPFVSLKYRLADRLVLSKIRNIIGGDKKFLASGGAPLIKEIGEFFQAAGVLICEGYGLTETSPMISFNRPTDIRFGTVGKTAPKVKVRFGENGEIQVKGPNVMIGYHNKPELTRESFVDGWFRTGDVGEFDSDGFLKITDRIKDLIITSTGKNIARQRVELTLGKDHYIEQVIAIGNDRSYLSALVVPYFEALEEYAKERKIPYTSREDLIKRREIIDFYDERIASVQKELASFEQIKKFTLLSQEFSQALGEITPTLKNRRKVIMERYGDLIDKMYEDEDLNQSI